jgi:hypothetical protein
MIKEVEFTLQADKFFSAMQINAGILAKLQARGFRIYCIRLEALRNAATYGTR